MNEYYQKLSDLELLSCLKETLEHPKYKVNKYTDFAVSCLNFSVLSTARRTFIISHISIFWEKI